MSVKEVGGLYLLPTGTTINGQKYVNLLKEKLELHINERSCGSCIQDGAPCHRSNTVSIEKEDSIIMSTVLRIYAEF